MAGGVGSRFWPMSTAQKPRWCGPDDYRGCYPHLSNYGFVIH